ncbi:MAG: YdcF family protein [Rhodospirillales bacterium]|nr:YdcF family protein [Rhodospirillales bacterium]
MDQPPSACPPADAAIVLGAAVAADGSPTAALTRRARHGAAVTLAGKARFLLLSGGGLRDRPSEASVMRRLALSEGVEENKILLEEQSRNTLENVTNSLEILAAQGWRRVLVVSDLYHLPRALYTFRRFGVSALGEWPREGGPVAHGLRPWLREAAAVPLHLARTEWAIIRRTRRQGR